MQPPPSLRLVVAMDPYGQSQPISCPQCGAPAPFRGAAVSLVCEFCDSTIVRTGVNVQLIGKVSALVDNGSPVILGSRGRHRGTPFEVAGRLQVSYSHGTWNEWFIEFADGTTGWLADAQGQFSIVKPKDSAIVANRVPAFTNLDVNMVLTIDGIEAVVVDRRGAAYKGAEGILPFQAEPGLVFYGADLRGFNGEFISLDYGNSPGHASPVPYLGEAIELGAVGLHPLRQFEGWRFTGWQGQPGQPQGGRA